MIVDVNKVTFYIGRLLFLRVILGLKKATEQTSLPPSISSSFLYLWAASLFRVWKTAFGFTVSYVCVQLDGAF